MSDIRIVRMRAVQERTGLNARTIRRLVQRGDFPAPMKLSTRAVGWTSDQLDAWIKARPSKGA
jgi:prophage regulatory protein